MRKNTIYIIIMSFLLCGVCGCGRWLDIKPYDEMAEDDLLSTENGFIRLLNGIYIELNTDALYGSSLTVEMIEIMGGAYAIGTDNAVWGNYYDLSVYRYGTDYWRQRFSSTWDKAYAMILNCNLLLENIDKEEKKGLFSGDNRNIIKGEALALRAMLHFDMLRLFGPVYANSPDAIAIPYYTAYTTVPEAMLPASEAAGKIMADLKNARILLSSDPVRTEGTRMDGPSDGTSNFLYYRNLRLNYYAVTALLARASLYFGNKADALTYATEVIGASGAGIFPFVDRTLVTGSPADPDRIFSSEVIFALSHARRNELFKNWYDPSRMPNYVFRMDNDVFSRIVYGGSLTGGSLDDYRCRANWIASGSNRYFYKYSDMVETGNIRNTMVPLIRLGEMYLIAAESQSENLGNGLQYVNTLRSKRGTGNLPSLTQELLQYEYIRELYGEGQLFFMYKRMFSPVIKSANGNNPQPSDEIFVVPTPDTETQN
ncbi:MAG: RagB/SusD family nutrient uptake outer membrane protein [Bacteroidales bacterium]|nr:RagB/SusD family nutrient uptake outer membrane protein [Bacteroidales bacterium]